VRFALQILLYPPQRETHNIAMMTEVIEENRSGVQKELNEGIALINAQRFDEAQEVLMDATRRQPDSARGSSGSRVSIEIADGDPRVVGESR